MNLPHFYMHVYVFERMYSMCVEAIYQKRWYQIPRKWSSMWF